MYLQYITCVHIFLRNAHTQNIFMLVAYVKKEIILGCSFIFLNLNSKSSLLVMEEKIIYMYMYK